jgi:transposase-like protein
MSNNNVETTCRSRACREGWYGRRRTYKCKTCKAAFQVDTLNPLPEGKRVCPKCKPVAVSA